MARTTEKVILGVFLVLILGVGSVFVTAMVTNKNPLKLSSSRQFDDSKEISEAITTLLITVYEGSCRYPRGL